MAIITLITDFGLSDPYVGSMKGVILSLNPAATIVDISHEVGPQCVEQGAFVLAAAWPHFPAGSIHVAVVDPGVGGRRRAVALETPSGVFIGPDNGILSPALPDEARRGVPQAGAPAPLPPSVRAFQLADPRFHRHPVSPTFHGRDIFAPAAAHVSLGVSPAELGPPLAEMTLLPPFRAIEQPDGTVIARIVHVDRFGNLVTTARAEQLPPRLVVEAGGRKVAGLAETYGAAGGLAALVGSGGFLEIALPRGSAARELGAKIGDRVTVRPLEAPP